MPAHHKPFRYIDIEITSAIITNTVLPPYNANIEALPFLALWRGGIMVREVI